VKIDGDIQDLYFVFMLSATFNKNDINGICVWLFSGSLCPVIRRVSMTGIHCCTGAGQGVWQGVRGGRGGRDWGTVQVQGARGIAARFLKWSPASTVSPIMTKFSQYTPHSTCYLVLVSICRQE
jgi:hypothetical protein